MKTLTAYLFVLLTLLLSQPANANTILIDSQESTKKMNQELAIKKVTLNNKSITLYLANNREVASKNTNKVIIPKATAEDSGFELKTLAFLLTDNRNKKFTLSTSKSGITNNIKFNFTSTP